MPKESKIALEDTHLVYKLLKILLHSCWIYWPTEKEKHWSSTNRPFIKQRRVHSWTFPRTAEEQAGEEGNASGKDSLGS